MRRFLIPILAGCTLAVSVHAQQPEPTVERDSEAGRRVFNDRGCYQCHGYEAHAGPGSRLAPDPIPFARFSGYVRNPTGQMPPYTSQILSDRELADIYAFLDTIPEPPAVESLPVLRED